MNRRRNSPVKRNTQGYLNPARLSNRPLIRTGPRINMSPMRYVLNASERAFKAAVKEFVGRAVAGPDASGLLCYELGKWLPMFRPAGLSRVEEAVALEEITRRFPESGPKLVASGLFGALSPGLCRAAADLGRPRASWPGD